MYNCAAQIGRVVAQIERVAAAGHDLAVLLIDNRSRDDTVAVAQAALDRARFGQAWLLRNDENYGLGGSHKVAFGFAREHGFDYVIVLHGDDQGALSDIVPHVEAGEHVLCDALLGARFQPGARLQGYSPLRTWANRVFNLIFSVVSGHRLYDLGSGLNLFRTAIFDDGWHLGYADDLTFNYYLILGLVWRGHKVSFFPISWREDDQVSNARLTSQGLRMLRLLWRRIVGPRAFFARDHRDCPRAAYPATVLWHTPADEAAA